jgi:DTW domain-containing protein YfiP
MASATHVVFLQHPRESRVAIGTCRMAHLALPGSELYRGVVFEDHARVRALAADRSGRVAVVHPSDGAREPEALASGTPHTLIVIDGTWQQVRGMLRQNPALRRLPRIGFTPSAPGNYRIRREPAPYCLATIEAVVEVLGRLERDAARFRPMLRAFERMVETEIAYRMLRPGAPWRRTKRQRQARECPVRATLVARREHLLVIYAEANAHPLERVPALAPEIVQLVAVRPSTGERFAAVVAPRGPLAPSTPHHLDIAADHLTAGEDIASAMSRWHAFVRPHDLLCAWGYHTRDLLRREGAPERPVFDLRAAVTRRLQRRPGGIEQAASLLGGDTPAPTWTEGRAGRRIAALAEVVQRLTE